ncbi:hypothetical protein [Proteiniclasticum sp.]|uniref:hypothetical protein n=1 Tax=Proteiniclasticum sp. TaxID=2053595 RepID=UPI00289FF225|nr:hypothetical protein [Proteiniclasticum sp.]
MNDLTSLLSNPDLASYLEYRDTLSSGELRFSYIVVFLWMIVFAVSLWWFIRIKRRDIDLINAYIEKLFPDESDYGLMLKGIERYGLTQMIFPLIIVLGTLLFPTKEIHWFSTALYLTSIKAAREWYRKSEYNTFIG